MDWAWVIPIIAFIVWIISQVIRAGQQANLPQGPQRQPQVRPLRPADAEIDRFLEEINRRRQAQAGRPVEERVPPRREAPAVQPVEAPAPKPARVRPAPRVKPVSQPPPVRRPAASLVEPLPTPPPPPTPPPMPNLVQTAQAQAAAIAAEVGSLEFKPIAPVKRPEPPPLLKRLREMLTSDGIRAAILVNELISPPRCLRHFRR